MASSPTPPVPDDRYLRLHAVNVYVRDQERSLRFFLDKLGFQVAFDARVQSGQRMVAVSPPDGTAVLTLVQPGDDLGVAPVAPPVLHVILRQRDVVDDRVLLHQRARRARGAAGAAVVVQVDLEAHPRRVAVAEASNEDEGTST